MKKNIIKTLFVFMFLIQVLPINVMASDVQDGQPAVEEIKSEENPIDEEQMIENMSINEQEVDNINHMEELDVELIDNLEDSDMKNLARGIDNLSVKKSFLDTVKDNLFLVTSLIIISIFAVTIFIKLKRKKI